jgi:type III secretion protein L
MALVILKLSPAAQLATDSRILGRIEAEAVADVSKLRQQALVALEQAQRQAMVVAEEHVKERVSEIEKRLQKGALLKALGIQMEYERTVQELRDTFVDTVMSCISSMMLPPPPEFFARVQASAAEMIGEAAEVALHVAAADENTALDALLGTEGSFRVVADPNLAAGQCFLETKFGRIQAGLSTQLEAIHESLDRWWDDAAQSLHSDNDNDSDSDDEEE